MHFRIVAAGCGSISDAWLRGARTRSDAEVVALVDPVRERGVAAKARHTLDVEVFTDLGKAIRATAANVVFDLTPPLERPAVVRRALEFGCHVLGEKPMALTMFDAHRMIETANRVGRTYAVMQNLRFEPGIRRLREGIASGAIGDVGFVCVDSFVAPHYGGFREEMTSPLLFEMAIHTFDQARFLLGVDPVSVYCREFNPRGSWYRGNAAAICEFEFATGAVLSYRGSWCAEGFATAWAGSWRVVGSKGTALWDGWASPRAEVVVGARDDDVMHPVAQEEWPTSEHHRTGRAVCLDDMFNALRDGRQPETVCTDNVRSLAMVLGAVESARSGDRVTLSYERIYAG